MRPSLGVNLTALESRFQKTCRKRSGSPALGSLPDRAGLQTNLLGLCGGTHSFDRGFQHFDQS